METNKKLMKVSLLIALLVAFMVPGSPAGPAVVSHEAETSEVCAQDAAGADILCVSATRDPHPQNTGEWTGWCETTDAEYQGHLTCTDSSDRDETCTWDLGQDGCDTDQFTYVNSNDYEVTAVGCMNPARIDEVIEVGPVKISVEEEVEEASVCLTASVPGSSGGGGDTGKIILH